MALCVMVLLVCAGLLRWVSAQSPSETPVEGGPRPVDTRSGRALLVPPDGGGHTQAAVKRPEAPDQTLIVVVGSWANWSYDPESHAAGRLMAMTAETFPPTAVWPDAADAPFPDHPVTGAVVGRVGGDDVPLGEILALAEDAGTLVDSPGIEARPWAALLALQIEVMEGSEEWAIATEAWRVRNDVPRRGDVAFETYYAALRAASEPPPKMQRGAVLALSTALILGWPDHPIADFARLYQLDSLSDEMSTTRDREALTRAALSAMDMSSDPVVAQLAVQHLSNEGGSLEVLEMSAADLDLAARMLDELDNPAVRRQLADVAMQSALGGGHLERAAWWFEQNKVLTDAFCDSADGSATMVCPAFRAALHNAESFLASRSAVEPVTWQGALTAVARRCHRDVGFVPDPHLHGAGQWDEGWRWDEWSAPDDALATCIRGAESEGPPPPAGQRVELYVLGPREWP